MHIHGFVFFFLLVFQDRVSLYTLMILKELNSNI